MPLVYQKIRKLSSLICLGALFKLGRKLKALAKNKKLSIMVPMSTLDEKNGTTALAQALKTELSTADWPKEGNVIEVSFMKKVLVRPILTWAALALAFFTALK